MSLHALEMSTVDGFLLHLSGLRGRAVLLVVLGTGERTRRQLAGLQALHVDLRRRGGTVYGVPTDAFGPFGGNQEAERRLSVEHPTTFPLAGTTTLRGEDPSPLAALLEEARGAGAVLDEAEKVLFDVDGVPLRRWSGEVPPDDEGLRAAVDAALPPPPELRPRPRPRPRPTRPTAS